jgi:hypothetical protein
MPSVTAAHTEVKTRRTMGGPSLATAAVLALLGLAVASLATQIATLLVASEAALVATETRAAEGSASVKLDSASIKLDQVLAHNEADNVTATSLKLSEILTTATYAPMAHSPSLQDFVGLSPEKIENIERIAVTVPSDWECQSRVSGGVWACPNGIPPVCRYYKSTEYTDTCVLKFCSYWDPGYAHSNDFRGWGNFCCKYFVEDSTSAETSATSWLHNMPGHHNFDEESDPPHAFSYSYSYDMSSGETATIGSQLATKLAADPTACDAEEEKLTLDPWGPIWWWDDPNLEINYINFKVVRFEMGQGLGLQLYSVQNDVIIIRPDKTITFKAIGAEMNFQINPELTFTPPVVSSDPWVDPSIENPSTNIWRRELKDQTSSRPNPMDAVWRMKDPYYGSNVNIARFTGSCHPYHGCPAAKKTNVSAVLRARRALKSSKTPRQLEEERRKLGFFSALMTSGSFMMMQAGAF